MGTPDTACGPQPPPFTSLDPLATESQLFARLGVTTLRDTKSLPVLFRHSGWMDARCRIFASFSRTNQSHARMSNFCYCGTRAYVLESVETPGVYRIAGSACHDRFCLPCANERSRAVALNVVERTKGKQLRFITLTLKSDDEPLDFLLEKLYASFGRLRRRTFWKHHVTGGVAFLELKWSSENRRWHPHFHVLVEGRYIPRTTLKQLWYEITTDSHIVDIRIVRDPRAATKYVTKYASKPFNTSFINDPDRLDEALMALKGRKLCLTFANWRGVALSRRPNPIAWEYVGTLEQILISASQQDHHSRSILESLTTLDLSALYKRAPPLPTPHLPAPPPINQNTFFSVWQADGSLDPRF